MAKIYESLTSNLQEFIENQKIFFVATAGQDGRINLSPKGLDSLRVLDANRVIWLNMTGSGNETAAHLREVNRMTIMFCAFEGNPLILRLYGSARMIQNQDKDWDKFYAHFGDVHGARQIFELHIDSLQTSCGFGVPHMDYVEDRSILADWAAKKNDDEIKDYWKKKNLNSIDGKPTGIFDSVSL